MLLRLFCQKNEVKMRLCFFTFHCLLGVGGVSSALGDGAKWLMINGYRVGGKNYQRTNRARCGSTGASAPGSVNFLSAGAVNPAALPTKFNLSPTRHHKKHLSKR